MMRSLFSGVSGLKNHQTRMDVIGNNIANVNTTGYKSSRVTFTDTLQQTLSGASAPTDNVGGTNPKQIGLGSAVGSIDMIMTDGSVQSTGKNTDLCLSGSGFFVVKGSGGEFYTRDGAFEFDKAGNYVLPGSGLYVQGWTADQNGEINTVGPIDKIVVQAGKSMEATATTTATYTNNIDAGCATIVSLTGGESQVTNTKTYTRAAEGSVTATATNEVKLTLDNGAEIGGVEGTSYTVGNKVIDSGGVEREITQIAFKYLSKTTATADNPVTIKMSDGTTYTQTSGTYNVGHSLPVSTIISAYDTLGNAHEIPVYFTKTKTDSITGNEWTVSITTDGTGTSFIREADGSITDINMPDVTLKFTTDGKYDDGSGNKATLTLTNGSKGTQEIILDLSTLTQYSGANTISNSSDGNAMGSLKSIAIDSAGVITGTYTNGINRQEGQVAIAQFSNPAGLMKNGTSLYTISNNSGTPNVKTATDLGVTITPSALEMSNVDIANEFSDMIITQRGFQSNSKIITVSDEMLETLVNMKR